MLLNKIILELEIAGLSIPGKVTRFTKRGVPVDHEPGGFDWVTGRLHWDLKALKSFVVVFLIH